MSDEPLDNPDDFAMGHPAVFSRPPTAPKWVDVQNINLCEVTEKPHRWRRPHHDTTKMPHGPINYQCSDCAQNLRIYRPNKK